MKKTLILTLTLGLGAALAQDADYPGWMKAAGGSMGPLKKSLDAKSMKEAAEHARKIEAAFAKIEAFWAARNASDAVTLSQTARNAAKEVAASADAGHADHATAAFARIGSTCKSCHDAHREKAADGSWKIK